MSTISTNSCRPAHIGVAELITLFARIHERHVILIIDEYDRVTGEDNKRIRRAHQEHVGLGGAGDAAADRRRRQCARSVRQASLAAAHARHHPDAADDAARDRGIIAAARSSRPALRRGCRASRSSTSRKACPTTLSSCASSRRATRCAATRPTSSARICATPCSAPPRRPSAHQGSLWSGRRHAGRDAPFQDVLFYAARAAPTSSAPSRRRRRAGRRAAAHTLSLLALQYPLKS